MADVYTVVVGMSETSWSPVALQWAVKQAERFDGRVIAVRVRNDFESALSDASLADMGEGHAHEYAQERLDEQIAAVLGADHDVTAKLIEGRRRKVLVEESRDADLLVIDAPRGPTLRGKAFAHRLVYRAHCPVVIMPPDLAGRVPVWMTRLGVAVRRDVLEDGSAAAAQDKPLSAY